MEAPAAWTRMTRRGKDKLRRKKGRMGRTDELGGCRENYDNVEEVFCGNPFMILRRSHGE